MAPATKKASLVGRKRTKDLQSSAAQLDATKQTLLEMQQDDQAKKGRSIVPQKEKSVVTQKTVRPRKAKPVSKKDIAQSVKISETRSTPASVADSFETDAVKYLLTVYQKLSGFTENRFDYSPYQRHQKLIEYFKKVVNARAEVHAKQGMPLDQNQAMCQEFVDVISKALQQKGIELNPLKVVPE